MPLPTVGLLLINNIRLNMNKTLVERQGVFYEVDSQIPYSGPFEESSEQGLDIGNYIDGKLDGLWESYWGNGQLYYRCNFKDGKLDGLWEEFDKDGNLTKTENYKDGKKDGILQKIFQMLGKREGE